MNRPGSATTRRLLSRSAFIFAIRFFPAAATLAALIAFAHLETKDVTGVYNQLWVYLTIAVAVAGLGIPPLMLTHTADTVHRWLLGLKARQVVLFGLWLGICTAMLIGLPGSGQELSPQVLATLFIIQTFILLVETYLIINQRFAFLATVSILYSAGFCALHAAYLAKLLPFSSLLWAIAGLGLIRLLIISIVARMAYRKEAAALPRRTMTPAIRKQWAQLGIYDVSQQAFRWLDKLIIARIVDPALFAVYSFGTTDVPFISLLLGAAGNSLLQQMASEDSGRDARIRMVRFSGSVLARIVFPVFFFFFFFRAEFIRTVFSDNYAAAIPLFGISVLALPLRAYNYTSLLQHLNRVKTINIGAVLDLVIALSLAWPLYRSFGLPGMAIAFMVSNYAQAAFYIAATARYMRCSVFSLIPWKSWCVMLIVIVIAVFFLHDRLKDQFSDVNT